MRRLTRLGVAVACLVVPATAAGATVLDGTVVWVFDGDTIEVALPGGVARVRYIGVNAPEVSHHGIGGEPGAEAAARLNRALVSGRRVRIELDVETHDAYGRLLGYVWTGGVMANAELVRRGWARAFPIAPNLRYQTLFAALEREARAAERGVWGVRTSAREPMRRFALRLI